MRWTNDSFQTLLNSQVEDGKSLETNIRMNARKQIQNWQNADIYPVIGYHPDYMDEPELIGAALVGTPRRWDLSCVSLYSFEEEVSDELCEFVDMVMELNDGLDSTCEIMLEYHRAIIPVKGETLVDWKIIFAEVAAGVRSTNYRKLSSWNLMERTSEFETKEVSEKVAATKVSLDEFLGNLLNQAGAGFAEKIMESLMPDFDEKFREEWS